jgi:hypothetical protein
MANVSYTRTNGADPRTSGSGWARFYMDTIPDEAASKREGRRIYKQEERVEITMPGNSFNIPVKEVTDEHRQRWPKEYEAFKAGLDPVANGIPLEDWPVLNRAQVLELKFLNFRTVEDVAGAADSALQRIGMGGFTLRDKARAYLDDAQAMELVEKITAENNALKSRLDVAEQQVSQMGEQLKMVHEQLQRLQNAPSPIATAVPAHSDPLASGGTVPPAAAAPSSLSSIQPTRGRRGKAA